MHTDSGTIASAIDTSVIAFYLDAELEKPYENQTKWNQTRTTTETYAHGYVNFLWPQQL